MAQAMKWLCYQMCMRQAKAEQIHPDSHTYDAVIVWKEGPKEKAGGMAYEVILKPASTNVARPPSPPKDRPKSQEVIEKKLKDAEERRQSLEAAKLEKIAKDKAKLLEAQQKITDLNSSFSKETEEKLNKKLESFEENKNAQIKALQERLRDHANRVEEVRRASDKHRDELKEKIEKKLESYQENRDKQFRTLMERLEDHEKHVKEVLEASSNFSKRTEEKMIAKMETTLKNRENQLSQLMEKLQEHEKHVQEVRSKKPAQPVEQS